MIEKILITTACLIFSVTTYAEKPPQTTKKKEQQQSSPELDKSELSKSKPGKSELNKEALYNILAAEYHVIICTAMNYIIATDIFSYGFNTNSVTIHKGCSVIIY